ncbi:MAG: nitrite/sulfite reductase [Porticoccaceae bacterium]|nr:nitrite/sulfite reductase [Porticoccaceae bacterium]
MYRYDSIDQQIVDDRVAQFRDQTQRYLAGEIAEEEFLPLRLQNGLYVQRLAPMLRVCVPYGMLDTKQVRMLAHIARKYDKGYAHVTTRQNIQYNWPALEDVPDILADLASVEMHAIQTSGNCIRNFTADPFAGVALDEVMDPRPYCEVMRQWATFHPEFAFLPRKFKMAVCGSKSDRAAILVHDIGMALTTNDAGEIGFEVFVGGGLGRTPVIASLINSFVPEKDILTYLEAILRVYNLSGNRENKYKARIKILVRAMGAEAFAERVDQEWKHLKGSESTLTAEEIERMKSYFPTPDYREVASTADTEIESLRSEHQAFDRWLTRNTRDHRQPGYVSILLSLKPVGVPPGDVTAEQLDAIADLADKYSLGEVRTTHEQNMVLADVAKDQLFELWQDCKKLGFASPTIGTLNDMICCPGGDFCSLANAKSIPVAEALQRKFDDLDYLYDLGDLSLNISGCMNACGHHHVGHVGVLGVDKKGEEWYQIQLGGDQGKNASLAKVLGPSFSRDEVPEIIEKLLNHFVDNRIEGESFLEAYRRIGHDSFKAAAYA